MRSEMQWRTHEAGPEPRRSFIEQARRQQIVRGAIEVIAADGLSAGSLAAIASHVGVSKGVLSYHFAGKNDLLREVVRSVLADAEAFMRPQVEASATAPEMLRTYVRANLEFLAQHRAPVRALAEILNGLPPGPDGTTEYEPAADAAVNALAALLEAGQRTGEFGDFSATIAARSIRASIDAVTGLLRRDQDLDVAGNAEQLLRLIERACRP